MDDKINNPSINDVARLAGVSTTLVSFVLNGKDKEHRVSSASVKRVREAAEKLNYHPNTMAKGLREGVSNVIGAIISDISNPFFGNIVRCINAVAGELGYMTVFMNSNENTDIFGDSAMKLIRRQVDGLIVVPCESSGSVMKILEQTKVPMVQLDRFFPELNVDSVCLDNEGASARLTDYLIGQGYKKIGMVTHNLDISCMKERIAGFRKRIEANPDVDGMEFHADFYDVERSCARASEEFREAGCDAFLFASNGVAVPFMKTIAKTRREDIGSLGFAGIDAYEPYIFLDRPFPFVSQPIEAMARKSVELLLDRIRSGGGPVRREVLQGTFTLNK